MATNGVKNERWVDEYLDYLKIHEDGDHQVFPYNDPLVKNKKYPNGLPTYEYGITQPIRDKYSKNPNESEKEYATRVLKSEYIPRVTSKIGKDAWDNLPNGMKKWSSDLVWNAGSVSSSIADKIINEDYNGALKTGLEYVIATSKNKDGTPNKKVIRGLADRVSSRHNLAASDSNLEGVMPITNFDVVQNPDNTTTLNYKSGDNTYYTVDKQFKANRSYSNKVPKNVLKAYPEITDRYAYKDIKAPDVPAQVEDFGGLVNAKPEALPSPNEKPMEFPNKKATLPLGLEASDTGAIKSLQKSIGVKQDGDWGPKSQTAYDMMFNGRNQFAQTDPRRTDLTPSNGTIPVREYAQDMRSQPRTEALNPIRNFTAEDMMQQGMGRARIVEPIRPLERTYDFNTMEDLLMSKGLMPNPLL
jgi:hypothetical protein